MANAAAASELERRGFSLVRKLALPAETIATIEGSTPDLHGWLGGRSLVERVGEPLPSLHERTWGFTRLVQPVVANDVAALVSHAVAIDTNLKPHVTSIVDEVISRPTSPARSVCVATFDVARASCDGAELAPLESDWVRSGVFQAPGVPCMGCHTDPKRPRSLPLSASKRETQDARHAEALLDELRRRISALAARNPAPG
jgi:hypothetical protein